MGGSGGGPDVARRAENQSTPPSHVRDEEARGGVTDGTRGAATLAGPLAARTRGSGSEGGAGSKKSATTMIMRRTQRKPRRQRQHSAHIWCVQPSARDAN